MSEYVKNGYVDAFIASYFMLLGEFNYDNYGYGTYKKWAIWCGFILGTFLCCVVFMNMLIAIMGETFGNVMA